MNVHEAIKFLRDDNLVWSNDFDAIRHDLADLLGSLEGLFAAAKAISGELIDEG